MVLENASSPSSDGFENDADRPQSDRDPYSSSSAVDPNAISVDASNWPKPIPILGPIFGFTPKLLQNLLQRQVITSTQVLGRQLNEVEVEALGYWTAKSIAIQSIGPPIGIAGGIYRARATREQFKFPFFTPDLAKMDVNVFPTQGMKLFSGQAAQSAWHAMRGTAYASMGYFIGTVLLSSYAASIATIGEMSDPRLKALIDKIRDKAKQAQGRMPNAQNAPQRPGEAKVWKGQTRQVDDASPTGGYGLETPLDLSTNSERMLTDEEIQAAEAMKTWSASKPTPYQNQKPAPQSNSVDDAFDDASPTGGRGMQTSQSSGSAWERIRQQQASSGGDSPRRSAWSKNRSQAQQGQAQQKEAPTDSFAFSSTDEERQLAQSEAQKDFDARLDQERRGGEFSSGSGDRKRW